MHVIRLSAFVYDLISILAITVPILSGLMGAGLIRRLPKQRVLVCVGIAIWEVHELPLMVDLITSYEPLRMVGAAVLFCGTALLSTFAPYAFARGLLQGPPKTWIGLLCGIGYCLDLCGCTGLIGWDLSGPGLLLTLAIIETLAGAVVPLYVGHARAPAIPYPRFLLSLAIAVLLGSYFSYGLSFATGLSSLR